MSLRVMIAGGGTGGHLFPGVAIAEELKAADPTCEIQFVGTTRGIEARVLPKLGWDHRFIEVSGLKTVGLLGALRGLWRLPRALWQAYRVVAAFRPDAVIGVGGYASGPVVLMARLRGIATAICEQNSIPGLTNKILGKFVHRVFLAFDYTRPFFAARKVELVGTPIRVPMLQRLEAATGAATPAGLRIFICGGSLGAVKLNELVVAALAEVVPQLPVEVVHQTGSVGHADTVRAYRDAGLSAQVDVREFIDDMAGEYARADVVIARAGAATVAELAIAGKPTIFVPYPYAADNHQEQNAREIVEGGGALMFRQRELTASQLAAELLAVLRDVPRRQAMAVAIQRFAKPAAGRTVAAWCRAQA